MFATSPLAAGDNLAAARTGAMTLPAFARVLIAICARWVLVGAHALGPRRLSSSQDRHGASPKVAGDWLDLLCSRPPLPPPPVVPDPRRACSPPGVSSSAGWWGESQPVGSVSAGPVGHHICGLGPCARSLPLAGWEIPTAGGSIQQEANAHRPPGWCRDRGQAT